MRQYEQWRLLYDQNLQAFRQKKKEKLLLDQLKVKDSIYCDVCGKLVTPGEVEYHLLKHAEQVESGKRYQIDLTCQEANREIQAGTKFLRLYWNYYKDYVTLTYLNALLIPKGFTIQDQQSNDIRFNHRKQKFVKLWWVLALICTIIIK